MDKFEGIYKLKKLSLEEPNIEIKILNILNQIQSKGQMVCNIHEGNYITRFCTTDVRKDKINLSHKPAILNKTPQRATLANETAFYGSISGIDYNETYSDQIIKEQAICSSEVLSLYTNYQQLDEQILRCSIWRANTDIPVATIVHPSIFNSTETSSLYKDMKHEYCLFLSSLSLKEIHGHNIYSQFWASEFSKIVNNNNQYKFSASYGSYMLNKYGGVVYPSVQSQGYWGLCIALDPKIALRKLDLIEYYNIHIKRTNDKEIEIHPYGKRHLVFSYYEHLFHHKHHFSSKN